MSIRGLLPHRPRSWRSSRQPSFESKSQDGPAQDPSDGRTSSSPVFWPADLLPTDCPNARILVYGYDTQITKYMTSSTNKNSTFSHGKDLVFELGRTHPAGRPLIFVAHSLGGILVKEMLATAASSSDNGLRNIIDVTAAVIFLGTPHRGSPELTAVAAWARGFISAIRFETNAAILDTLGLRNSDLERVQETFSTLWRKHDFRVKTFQEGLGLTGFNLGVLGNKVVPDYSSILGDAREQAETLQANHMSMCRYSGADDSSYAKVAGEIKLICTSLMDLAGTNARRRPAARRRKSASSTASSRITGSALAENIPSLEHNWKTRRTLRYLRFTGMDTRLQTIRRAANDTCQWLFEHETYRNWFGRHDAQRTPKNGLLWLKGKPGSGKSTLMKQAFLQTLAQSQQKNSGFLTAAFFFNAKGTELERSPEGQFRSLLHQLLRVPSSIRSLLELSAQLDWDYSDQEHPPHTVDLGNFFTSLFTAGPTGMPKTIIFIDALDECNANDTRAQAYFWREIIERAQSAGIDLRVCVASRHFPIITLTHCPELVVENLNAGAIAAFVNERLRLTISDRAEGQIIRDGILLKSAGIFLWAVLALEKVLLQRDEGRGISSVLKEIDSVPKELATLFLTILSDMDDVAKSIALQLFQWVVLATKPLRLHEWEHILAFIQLRPPSSLQEWMHSPEYIQNGEQLEKRIRTISKGLVEVASRSHETDDSTDDVSVGANPGSLSHDAGETRVVQVIHESIREFFLNGPGFQILSRGGSNGRNALVGRGHLSIMSTCLSYLDVMELDDLVRARTTAGGPSKRKLSQRSRSTSTDRASDGLPSVASFGSAGSHHSHRPVKQRKYSDQSSTEVVFDRLRQVSEGQDGYLTRISMFEADADHVLDLPTHGYGPPGVEPQPASVEGDPKVLGCSPALLSYAVFELFSHARLADECGSDPKYIIADLQRRGERRWHRWLALHEELPLDTGLLYYSAAQNLVSWINTIVYGDYNPTMKNALKEAVMRSGNGSSDALGRLLECGKHMGAETTKEFIRSHVLGKGGVFFLALRRGTPEIIEQLCKTDRRCATQRYRGGLTPLHIACNNVSGFRRPGLVKCLLSNGASPQASDNRGRTPLHNACQGLPLRERAEGYIGSSAIQVVKHLLGAGLSAEDVNSQDGNGATALHHVCSVEGRLSDARFAVVDLLLNAGANLEAVDSHGKTPLYKAAEYAGGNMIAHLLSSGADDVMARADHGRVPLHIAAEKANYEAVKSLIAHENQDVEAEDDAHLTPLQRAYEGLGVGAPALAMAGDIRELRLRTASTL